MYEMYYHRAATANEIIRLIHIDKGYLSRILLKFTRRKLISKKRSPEDGRSVILSLTARGRTEFEKLDLASHVQIKEMIKQLPIEKHDELVFHMHAIKKILNRDKSSENESI